MSATRLLLVVADDDPVELRLLRHAAEALERPPVDVRAAVGTEAAEELLVDAAPDALVLGGPDGETGVRSVERARALGFDGPLVYVARGVAGGGARESRVTDATDATDATGALLRAGASEVLPRDEFSAGSFSRAIDAALRIEELRALVRRYRGNLVRTGRSLVRLERESESARAELALGFSAPLATAREFLGRVMDRPGSERSAVEAEYLDLALASLEQMGATLEQLTSSPVQLDPELDLESGREPTTADRSCPVAPLLRSLVATRRRPAETAGVELRLDIAPGALAARAGEAALGEALAILLDDALRGATRGTGVDFLVGPVTAQPSLLELRIETEDRGAPGELALARCRKLVQSGELVAHPRPGSGTSVRWVLPAERARGAA